MKKKDIYIISIILLICLPFIIYLGMSVLKKILLHYETLIYPIIFILITNIGRGIWIFYKKDDPGIRN